MSCVTRDGSFSMLWPDNRRARRVTLGVIRGIGETQYIGVGKIDIKNFNKSPETLQPRYSDT